MGTVRGAEGEEHQPPHPPSIGKTQIQLPQAANPSPGKSAKQFDTIQLLEPPLYPSPPAGKQLALLPQRKELMLQNHILGEAVQLKSFHGFGTEEEETTVA